jgi:hypothetical protein
MNTKVGNLTTNELHEDLGVSEMILDFLDDCSQPGNLLLAFELL